MNWNDIAADVQAVTRHVLVELRPGIEALAARMAAVLKGGGKILVCGNGGSAGDAQHLAGELVNRFLKERAPYACVALTTDSSVLTSIGNDYDFSQVFEKQVQALGRPGDLLIGISTSGNAANVLRAFAATRGIGLPTVAFTGGPGGKLVALADQVLSISCTRHTPRIQEGHLLVMHTLCERLEEIMEGG